MPSIGRRGLSCNSSFATGGGSTEHQSCGLGRPFTPPTKKAKEYFRVDVMNDWSFPLSFHYYSRSLLSRLLHPLTRLWWTTPQPKARSDSVSRVVVRRNDDDDDGCEPAGPGGSLEASVCLCVVAVFQPVEATKNTTDALIVWPQTHFKGRDGARGWLPGSDLFVNTNQNTRVVRTIYGRVWSI